MLDTGVHRVRYENTTVIVVDVFVIIIIIIIIIIILPLEELPFYHIKAIFCNVQN